MIALLLSIVLAWSGPGDPGLPQWLCYPPPVSAPITQPFRAPTCAYCAGHVVVGFLVAPGTAVTSLAPGVVVFAGRVAGVAYVEVEQDDGLRASYGRIGPPLVVVGARVVAGQVVGRGTGLVTLGLRQHGRPIDPTRLLGRWRGAARLVPVGAWPRRPAPPAHLTCATPLPVR